LCSYCDVNTAVQMPSIRNAVLTVNVTFKL